MISLNKDSKRAKSAGNAAVGLGGGVDEEFRGAVPGRSLALSTPKEFFRHYTVVLALIVTIVVFGILRPQTFLALSDVKTILTGQSALFALALTLTVALGAGEIDLSVGGALGFSSVLIAYLSAVRHISVPLSLAISLLVMLAVAAINSFLIVRIQVNGLIATLAMGTVLDGLSQAISNSSTIGNIPSRILKIMQGRFLGVGMPFWYAVLVGLIIWYVLHHMQSGRFLYFTGEGREAARLAGIRVNRIRTISLFVSALGAWFAGFILVG